MGFDVDVPKKSESRMAKLWVRDNGNGIEEASHDVIFNKFERLNQADTKGQGLGLSIVRRIVEKLGGEVGLESKLGKGSLFYFTLPIAESEYELHKLQNSKRNTISLKPASEKLKILIAEDDFVSTQLLHIIVKNKCEEVFLAGDGKEAVELFTKNPDIDLILMDIFMPIQSGIEAAMEIRKLNKDVVIIAQTAFAFDGDNEKTIEAGFNDYITKPIKKDELMEMIEKLF
jgi:CheY-like chemotaxis protein